MPLVKVEALILRNIRMGDTSRVLTVFSRELGKWSAVAKGVRDPRSRFGASLEILNLSSLVVYFRPGRDLQLIAEGSLEREHRALLAASDRYLYGCAILEFLDRVLEEEASVPEIFDLALRVLSLMEEAPGGRLGYLLRAFQLRVASWLGYTPRLTSCVGCGSLEISSFGPAEGGTLCAACAEAAPSAIALSGESQALLRAVTGGSLPRSPSVDAARDLERVAEEFLSFHIDRYRGLRAVRHLSERTGLPRPEAARPASAS
jgi:DNA repair protein RecO (recombination protein O)